MREWLMRLVAGRRPYWIADDVASQFAALHGVLGVGAVVSLIHSLQNADVSRAEFVVDGWTVTARRAEPGQGQKEPVMRDDYGTEIRPGSCLSLLVGFPDHDVIVRVEDRDGVLMAVNAEDAVPLADVLTWYPCEVVKS